MNIQIKEAFNSLGNAIKSVLYKKPTKDIKKSE